MYAVLVYINNYSIIITSLFVFHEYSSTKTAQNLKSLKLLRRFSYKELKGFSVQILSVLGEKLLVERSQPPSQLFSYCGKESHVTLLSTIPINEMLILATWTPRGNIVYMSNKVVTITELGEVKASTHMPFPLYLSVSSDDIIYLADGNKRIFQSTDDGMA